MDENINKQNKKYPRGHFLNTWTAIGIAVFSGLGVPISIITDNPGLIGIGPALGIVIGAAIGKSYEKKFEAEGKIRPLTDGEKRNQRRTRNIAIIFLIAGVIILGAFIYLRN